MKKSYYCVITGQPTTELHEIFGGSNRKHCVKYKIQVPLARIPHLHAHGQGQNLPGELVGLSKQEVQVILCEKLGFEKLGINYKNVRVALMVVDLNVDYLQWVSEQNADKLRGWEV